MPIDTHSSVLSADALEAFLDDTEEALDEQFQSELAPALIQDNVRDALQRHPYRADTLASVRRLARLWRHAGEPDVALQVLDGDGQAVLAAVPDDEREDTQLALALTRVEVLGDSPERALPAAEAAYALLHGMAHGAQSQEAWDYLGSLAGRAGLFELERRCAAGRHDYQRAQAARAPYRAYDKAHTALWRAHSYAREGAATQAQAAAAAAIKAFHDAEPGQDLDVNDWLYLGDSMVTLLPESVAAIVERVQAMAAETMPLPHRREIAVRAARLQARALHRQGALAEALETARGGRYVLGCDENDAFSALVLDWLLEAGQQSKAAALAFECVFNERPVSSDHACRVALAQLADDGSRSGTGASSPYWPLLLAWASTVEATAWVVGDEDPAAFFKAHLQVARAGGVALPAIDAVEGLYLIDSAHDYAAALPLLESAVRDPALTSTVVSNIWLCRMQLHGVERALQMPFVDTACAGWSYNAGVTLEYGTRDALAPGSAWPEDAVQALATRYYERGLAQFERFFETGQGMYRDGGVHPYSMLCNNLAIDYVRHKSDYRGALALHRKGIEASPFAEHYEGVMRCLLRLEDETGFLDAADQLWQYAARYGYSRHSPAGYIIDVAKCLHRHERGQEIPVWLERLETWWDSLDEEERAEHAGRYWDTLSVTLYCMGYTQETAALARLDAVLPALCAAGEPMATRMAANSLSRAGQHERALALYRQALAQLDQVEQPDPWHVEQRTQALSGMADCEQAMRASRPWWRFWK